MRTKSSLIRSQLDPAYSRFLNVLRSLSSPGSAAWIAWGSFLVYRVVHSATSSRSGVVPIYRRAFENWFAGAPLYDLTGRDFLYLPHAAIFFSPWGVLPNTAGEVAWQITLCTVTALGVFLVSGVATKDPRGFCLTTLVTIAASTSAFNLAQSTLLMSGLIIFGVVSIVRRQWWLAAVLIGFAIAVKPLAIFVFLLAAAVYLEMSWRLLVVTIVLFLIPFGFQEQGYVGTQYLAFLENSKVAYAIGDVGHWAQIFGALKLGGISTSPELQMTVRIFFAGSSLLAVWFARRHLSPERSGFYLIAISSFFILLFNPRTENNTYTIVAPIFAIQLFESWHSNNRRWITITMVLLVVLLVFREAVSGLAVPYPDNTWLAPVLCSVMSGFLISRLWQEVNQSRLSKTDEASIGG